MYHVLLWRWDEGGQAHNRERFLITANTERIGLSCGASKIERNSVWLYVFDPERNNFKKTKPDGNGKPATDSEKSLRKTVTSKATINIVGILDDVNGKGR